MTTLPDIETLQRSLERGISDVLILDLDLVAVPVRIGDLGLINPSDSADVDYSASIRASAPLESKIETQSHEVPDEAEKQRLLYATWKEKRMMGLRR